MIFTLLSERLKESGEEGRKGEGVKKKKGDRKEGNEDYIYLNLSYIMPRAHPYTTHTYTQTHAHASVLLKVSFSLSFLRPPPPTHHSSVLSSPKKINVKLLK